MRYIICPGYIISKNDGQRHYIGYEKLIRLYGVNKRDCVNITDYLKVGFKSQADDKFLKPQYSGDYSLGGK